MTGISSSISGSGSGFGLGAVLVLFSGCFTWVDGGGGGGFERSECSGRSDRGCLWGRSFSRGGGGGGGEILKEEYQVIDV